MEQLFADRLISEPRWRLWLETLADITFRAPREHWDILFADVGFGVRSLTAIPGFSGIVLAVIGLGIGTTVSIFSVVNAVLIRALPYGHPEELVYLWSPNVNFKGVPDELGPNVPDFYDWQRSSHSFSTMTMFRQAPVNVVRSSDVVRIGAAFVTGNFFQTFDAWPLLGRALDANDDQPGRERVAVVSFALWHSQFGTRPDVIGQQIRLNRRDYAVVGVMAEDFGYPFEGDVPYDRSGFRQTDIWLPAAYSATQKANRTDFDSAVAVGRLRNGVSAAAAQAELAGMEARLQPLYPEMWRGWTVLVKLLVGTIVGPVEKMLWLLLGAAGLVLLIAVSNVAGLLLARGTVRAHELGIRTALGAARGRIVRQLLTESLLLSGFGGILGIGFAYGLVGLLTGLNLGSIPRFESTSLDARVLLVAVLLSIATGLAAGLVPAVQASRPSVNDLLRRGGNRTPGSSNRGRFALIVLEVALSVVLLIGSGLLIRSYLQLAAVDPGFSPTTLTVKLNLDERYGKPETREALYKSFLAKLQSMRVFKYVGAANEIPLGGESVTFAEVRGSGKPREMTENRSVTVNYRRALGTPLLRGRDFESHDVNSKAPVMIVNEKFARTYFGDRDPLGGQVRLGIGDLSTSAWSTIIGVVGNIRHLALEEAGKPQVFQPVETGDNFAIRCDIPVRQAVIEAKAALRSLDPALTLEASTMAERIKGSSARRTFQVAVLSGFAAIALILALVGLYGLMSYTVKQRTAEIGIRLAIGSPRNRVLGLILWQGLRLTGCGLLIGLSSALALTRLITAWLFGVGSTDPITFVAVPLLLLGAACCACLLPAWNAARIDPIHAVRHD